MAYVAKDRTAQQLTGYGHGNGLADYGPNGQANFTAGPVGPGTHNYMANRSGATTIWPILRPAPLQQSGRATAMNTGTGFNPSHAAD